MNSVFSAHSAVVITFRQGLLHRSKTPNEDWWESAGSSLNEGYSANPDGSPGARPCPKSRLELLSALGTSWPTRGFRDSDNVVQHFVFLQAANRISVPVTCALRAGSVYQLLVQKASEQGFLSEGRRQVFSVSRRSLDSLFK